MKRRANNVNRQAQLLNQLRVKRRHFQRVKLQPVTDDSNLPGIVAGIVRVPICFQPACGFVTYSAGCSQNAGRLRPVAKELE